MKEVFIWLIVFCGIYLVSGLLLYNQSNTTVISARSQLLLYTFHIAVWIESIFLIIIIYSNSLNLTNDDDKKFWIINSIVGISHFVVYFPYLLRAYRLYLVFGLEENFEDYTYSKNYERTTQKWLLKVLFFLTLPVIIVYSFITILVYTNVIGVIYNPDTDSISDSPYVMIIIFLRFSEHLGLIIANYATSGVIDDFNMSTELTVVTVI